MLGNFTGTKLDSTGIAGLFLTGLVSKIFVLDALSTRQEVIVLDKQSDSVVDVSTRRTVVVVVANELLKGSQTNSPMIIGLSFLCR